MENRKKLSVFWTVMFVYIGVWITLTGVLSTKLWRFCASYQRDYDTALNMSNPDLVMDEAIKTFESENILQLVTTQFDGINELENMENAEKIICSLVENKKLTYKRTEKFSARKPAYMVFADDMLIGEVRLKQVAASDSFGFHLCEINEVKLLWDDINLVSVDFEAPMNSKVTVNGKEIDDTYLVNTKKVDSLISREAIKLTDVSFGTNYYHIDGFVAEPAIQFDKEEVYEADEAVKNLVLEANEAYIKNMNMLLSFDSLSKYFEPGQSAMANVKSAQSGLAWSGKPDKLKIKEVELSDIRKYSEDVFVATTKSKVYRLYRNVEYNEEMNYEWLYVLSNGEWKIRNFSYAN